MVIEVWVLEEKGYHLAPDQRQLTTLQKLFLALSSPVYARFKKRKQKEFEDNTDSDSFDSSSTPDEDELWRQKYLEKQKLNAERQAGVKHG